VNIKKDKKGKYYFVISAGFTLEGKRRQIKRTGFSSKKEAEEAYLKIKNELLQESFVDPSAVTMETFIDKWKKRKKQQIEYSTFIRYAQICRLQILPTIGSMKIQKISTMIIQNLIDNFVDNGFSRRSCQQILAVLKDIFRYAIKDGIIKVNPVQEIDLPKPSKAEMIIWDTEDINLFISQRHEKDRGRYYVAVLMALFTGMRKGEILGLTWDKIDFENNKISISQILECDGSKLSKRTKTKQIRHVLIPELLKEELVKHKKLIKKTTSENPDNLVFCSKRGKRVVPNTLNDVLDKICNKYNLPRMKFHDLRHTHATMLIKENINIKVIQERLGHARASTTLDIYSHVLPSMQQSVTDKLNKLYDCDSTVTHTE
jgi:integrase